MKKLNTQIFLDMDGVIANFFKALEEKYRVKHWKELDMNKIILELKGTNFFATIPKFKTSDTLISYINKITDGEWSILSSPLRYDNDNSAFWKRHWLAKHNYKPSDAIFTNRKEKYATYKGKTNILKDDKPQNIEKWIAKGGIGIRYQANENSLDYLYKQIERYIK